MSNQVPTPSEYSLLSLSLMQSPTLVAPSASTQPAFLTSHEDKFHRMPVTSSLISLSGVLRRSLTSAGMPCASLIARLFSSFCRPYDKFLVDERKGLDFFFTFSVVGGCECCNEAKKRTMASAIIPRQHQLSAYQINYVAITRERTYS